MGSCEGLAWGQVRKQIRDPVFRGLLRKMRKMSESDISCIPPHVHSAYSLHQPLLQWLPLLICSLQNHVSASACTFPLPPRASLMPNRRPALTHLLCRMHSLKDGLPWAMLDQCRRKAGERGSSFPNHTGLRTCGDKPWLYTEGHPLMLALPLSLFHSFPVSIPMPWNHVPNQSVYPQILISGAAF